MTEPERAELVKEIEDGGFGSELQARRILQDEGFDARSFYFHDLDDDKTRELDVRVYRRHNSFNPNSEVRHTIIAEVKSGYTWILGEDIVNDQGFSNIITQSLPHWFQKSAPKRVMRDPQWQVLVDCVYGYNLRTSGITSSIYQKKSDRGGDAWYEGASKVFKATAQTKPQSSDEDFFLIDHTGSA